MPRQNPFLRRASSPGDIHHESNSTTNSSSSSSNLLSVPPPLPNAHPAKLTQASLSDSALKVPVRPLTFRNTQSRTISIRPSRFIKASTPTSSTSSPIILNYTNTSTANSTEMTRFVRLFDTFTQKLYIEGYLMKHNEAGTNKPRTKMFVELSGSTLTLWDTEVPGSTIMPSYFQVIDTTRVYSNPTIDSNNKKKHTFLVQNKKSTLTLEASDEPTMMRWVCAIRLACFEKQKLHQLFTLKLLLGHHGIVHNASSASLVSTASDDILPSSKSTWLQVRVPGTSIWQKYWVVLVNKKKKDDHQQSSQEQQQHRSKMFGRKQSTAGINEEHILLFETKKSKTPVWTLSQLTQAYAVYPESPQLIEKGSMIRLDGQIKSSSAQQNAQVKATFTEDDCCCWFMADQSPLTIQWLLAVYDTFKLYGRPDALLKDPKNQHSLNFGEPLQDISNAVHPKLFLETDEVVQGVDVSLIPRQRVESFLLEAIVKKQQLETATAATVTVTRRPTSTRANSLPLITVISASEDVEESKKAANDSTANAPSLDSPSSPAPFKFARQVADSSDESEDDEDDLEDEDEDQDSDDEPIGRKTNQSPTTATSTPAPLESPTKKAFADSLIPDFDFGNGFDVPKNVTAAAVAAAVTASSLSQTLPTRGKQQGSRHRSSMTLFMDAPNAADDDDTNMITSSFSLHTRKSSMPATTRSSREQQRSASSTGYHSVRSTPAPPTQQASSSLFGDFSLATDFGKFLDEPLDQRKYSLPANVKLSSMESSRSTSSSNHNTNRWDQEWEDQEEFVVEEGNEQDQPQHPYEEDDRQSYNSDFDGPLIPSLGDHFAPQNSLLDTYLGEQLSAKEQIEYAKATGQPLIQVSTKKEGAPRGGLVGMISQREKDRKEGNGLRVAERVNQHHAQIGQDRFEREKERRILEQRQHQFLKHQVHHESILSGKRYTNHF
jgi:hypothetical protein